MRIEAFFHADTNTFTYVVFDPDTRDSVIIDPVLDFDPLTVSTSESSIEKLLAFVQENDLKVHYVLDTHAHADHLSGFQRLREATAQASAETAADGGSRRGFFRR